MRRHQEAQERLERIGYGHKMGTMKRNGVFTNALEIS